jgi:hypothetical protein
MNNLLMSSAIDQLASSLAKAQGELVSAKKASEGHGYSYSDLATVIEAAKNVLPKNGLSYTQLVGSPDSETVKVTTILMHSSGQFIGQEASIKVPEMRGVNDTQKRGAALSYLRRYSLQAILGMASEDNDASDKSNEGPKSVLANNTAKASVNVETNTKPAASTSFRRKAPAAEVAVVASGDEI